MNTYYVVDARSVLLHSYHRCRTKSLVIDEERYPSWEDALSTFITDYLAEWLKVVAPRQVLACFDGGNTARRRIYPQYKAKRRERDDTEPEEVSAEKRMYLEAAQRLMTYLGCRTARVQGEEADDLVALLCTKLEADHITIISRDADLLQLVNEKVSMVRQDKVYGFGPMQEQTFDGVPFNLIAFMKAIVGDSSDEYPGVPGAGPKFFQNLLETYGAEGLKQLDEIVLAGRRDLMEASDCKLLSKLAENWHSLTLFRKVAQVDGRHCYGSVNNRRKEPEWTVRIPKRSVVEGYLEQVGLYDQMAFWEKFFPRETLIDASNLEFLKTCVAEAMQSPIVSYDYETTDTLQHAPFREAVDKYVDMLSSELTGMSFNWGANLEKTVYVSFGHRDTNNVPREWAAWILRSFADRADRPVVQNANFELTISICQLDAALKNYGLLEPQAPYDTAIMASYVDENEEAHLKGMSKRILNFNQTSYEEVTKGRTMAELTAEETLSYGCDDSLVTSHLFDLFRIQMQCEGTWEFYKHNEVDWILDNVNYFIDGTAIDFGQMTKVQNLDEETIKLGHETMHKALSTFCNEKPQSQAVEAAKMLLEEWWVLPSLKFDMSNLEDAAKAQAKYTALWEKAYQGCYYTPPSVNEVIKFVPSAAQLTAVAALIDPALPPITKVSAKGIEEWVLLADESLPAGNLAVPGTSGASREFVNALYAARGNLSASKRSGQAYEALKELCERTIREKGVVKTVTSGDILNTGSSDQMQCLLYGKLGLPLRRRSKVTHGSTREKLGLVGGPATGLKAIAAAFVYDVLEDDDWRREVLLAYRDVAMAEQELSLYCRKYPLLVHPKDGRLHPQIKNCGTATRRPSGTAPNDLQVSKRGDKRIRRAYPGGDYGDGQRVYVCCDFAAQELVITACESKDPVMLDAFMSSPRKDLHSLTATSFAHIILERAGVHGSGPISYEDFVSMLHDDNCEIQSILEESRNTYAKACIAEGSPVLTDRGLVPIESVEISDLVWDGVEWVSHEGVIFKGVKEVITYDGVTATPDHKVFTDNGDLLELEKAASKQERPRLAVGETDGIGVGFPHPSPSSVSTVAEEWGRLEKTLGSENSVLGVRSGTGEVGGESVARPVLKMPMSERQLCSQRPQAEITERALQRDASEMHEPELEVLQELRGTGNPGQVQVEGALHLLGDGESSAQDLQRGSDRQGGQRGSLRAWELEACDAAGESVQQTYERPGGVPGDRSRRDALVASAEGRSSGVSSVSQDGFEISQRGDDSGGNPETQKNGTRWAPVYDIVNAGPRHRFTVSGKIVANCNFLITYGGSAVTLAENLLIEKSLSEDIIEGAFDRYPRLRPWQNETGEFAIEHGYTLTAYGNKRHAPKELWSSDKSTYRRAQRQLVNATVQSTAADILKVVLTEMKRREMRQRYAIKALKPVYDEVAASLPVGNVVDYAMELKEVMEVTPPGYPVGMKVDLSIGTTWGDVIKVSDFTREGVEKALDTVLTKQEAA